MIKSILVALDTSDYAEGAVKSAARLAAAYDASLLTVHVMDVRIIEGPMFGSFDGYTVGNMASGQMDELRRILEEKAASVQKRAKQWLADSGVKHTAQTLLAVPALSIVEMMADVDLTVLGARGEGARWGGAMLGGTVEKVAREGTKPLLVTRQKPCEFRKCLVAYDGSKHSQHSLLLAEDICRHCSSEIVVLTVNNNAGEGEASLVEARNLMASSPLAVKWLNQSGDAGPTIISAARDEGVDFVLMGAFGHSRIREAIIGSTTVEVMRGTEAAVLLVR
jgi:nucleotide-binding universal stress UspA family protein